MAKALMICPHCDDERAFNWAGIIQHTRARHPDKLNDLKDNKEIYLEKFKCDEFGNPVAPKEQKPDPEPPKDPAPEPAQKDPESDPDPEPLVKKTKTPKKDPPKDPDPTPTPKKEGSPESGGFLDELSGEIFGD